jgi:hypothetical protein
MAFVYSTHNPESSVERTAHRDPRYPLGVRDRGRAFEAPDWWLKIARPLINKTKGLVELGRLLAKRAGRATPWSHTVLSKFASGETEATQELAIAISEHFGIPRPFYVPVNEREAVAMQAIIDMRPAPSKFTDPVRIARERELIEQLEQLEHETRRQGAVLQSADEASGRSRSRRPRGVHRGG